MGNILGGVFAVQFLAEGDQFFARKGVTNAEGTSSMNLVQRINPDGGTPVPDWTQKPPVLWVSIETASGTPAKITAVRWAFHGSRLNFASSGMTTAFEENTDPEKGFFAKRSEDSSKVFLKIGKNIASKDMMANRQVSFEVDFVAGASSQTVKGFFDIDVQQTGGSSFGLDITASPGIRFEEDNTQITLTAQPYLGAEDITFPSDKYSIEWTKDVNGKEQVVGGDSPTLVVRETEVESAAFFFATLKKKGEATALAKKGIGLTDRTDTYRLREKVKPGHSGTVSKNTSAMYDLYVVRVNTNEELSNSNIRYGWTMVNAKGEKVVDGSQDLSMENKNATVTIKPEHCAISDHGVVEYQEVKISVYINIL